MKKSRVTLTDIAKALNISASTVSRALKDHPAINKETKRAVVKLAKKLKYQPNLLALGLLQKKTYTVGVIVPEITGHFFSTVITGIRDVLSPAGYNIAICLSNESFQEEIAITEKMAKTQIDGVLVSPASSTKTYKHFKALQKNGIPLVVFDRDCPGLDADKVLVDDYDGAFQAVEYLINSGCKNIAHLSGPMNLSITEHRLQGYLDALGKHKFPVKQENVIHVSGFTHEDGIKPAQKLLKLKNRPDAIFAMNDCIAISAMHVAKKMGLQIPGDVSIIGFDDEPHSSYFTPALSTIWQPVYSVGMLSARILLSKLQEGEEEPELRREVFKPELIIRASSKAV
ncbi:LacI family DNA-binding transcriptional regulator [Flagellimonas algicola]|uniref:LacI family transcriptional regulator n=1 Tax=Flagellimonas algicola TaxID=2583815 RepID=A0ABY2WRS6_9FLAO|nr:LacI family DNA-binding transcriptional regulator [Allomuricauda algicola]TMU57371.1 LacI family transcriptional regulator [Allomuricauda algicola]